MGVLQEPITYQPSKEVMLWPQSGLISAHCAWLCITYVACPEGPMDMSARYMSLKCAHVSLKCAHVSLTLPIVVRLLLLCR